MAMAAVMGVSNAQITVDRVEKLPSGIMETVFRVDITMTDGRYVRFRGIPETEVSKQPWVGPRLTGVYDMGREAVKVVALGTNFDTAVKADWLEEHGFPEAAAKLRTFDDGF